MDVSGRQPLTESEVYEQVAYANDSLTHSSLRCCRTTPSEALGTRIGGSIQFTSLELPTPLDSITSKMVRENTCIGMTSYTSVGQRQAMSSYVRAI